MSGKLRKFWVNVCALVLVVTLVINPNMMSNVRAEDTFTPIKTVFYVLNRGYERPFGTTSQKQAKYTKVGEGYIKYAINISEDDSAVADNIYIEPDSSNIIEDDEKIVWYVCKKESDGWHIDGEIVSKETDDAVIETATEITTSKQPETSTVEEETEPSNGELEAETTDISKSLITAHFAVLKDGYTRPSEAKSDKQYKYIKVGDGKIYKEITISNDDKAVLANIAKVPDLTDYIPEGKTVVWYVCKKEADGWHIDGEIVEKEAETSVTETEASTTEAVTKETDTSTIETSTTKETEPVTTKPVIKETEPVTTEEVTKATETVTTEEVTKATEQVTTEEVTKVTEPATTKALTTAHFAVLKDGYTRPSEAKSDKQYKYIKVGDGKIYDAVKIEKNDAAVLANIAKVPDLTDYIPDGKKVVWYVCKKEADGWHIDGEIVADEKITEEVTTKATEEETTEEETIKATRPEPTEEETTKETEEETTEEETIKATRPEPTEEETTKEETTTEEETTEVQKSNEELLREEMYQMLITGDTSEHDISKYHFTYIQMDKIWEKMVAAEGYIAKHATGMAYLNVTRNSDNTIKTIYFENMDSDFVNRYNRMLTAINEIKAATSDPTMTDLDRIMYVHDYLVERATFKETGFISHTAGGALGDGLAVCQGYTDALQVVFHEIGIDTYYVTSNAMNHAWIYVRLDGELYNIDATWDDGKEYNGGISRMYMLRSDSEYYGGLKHYSWNVYGTDEKATSGKYYKWFVHDIEGKMRYYNGYWYYVDTTANSIIKAKSDGSEMITVLDGSKLNTLTIDDITDGRLKYFVGNIEMTMPLN